MPRRRWIAIKLDPNKLHMGPNCVYDLAKRGGRATPTGLVVSDHGVALVEFVRVLKSLTVRRRPAERRVCSRRLMELAGACCHQRDVTETTLVRQRLA